MNFIQTLYIDNTKDPFRDSFGWASPEYHLMSWTLSCLQLHKLYGSVELFANDKAIDLLINKLQLPYSKVHDALNRLALPHNALWALSKIYTYSLQSEPFLHVDGDVFLFNRFEGAFLNQPLIAQNIEVATDYYTSTQGDLMRYFTFFPPCVKRDFESGIPIHAINAGILGGNNITFLNEYANTAIEYINKNIQNLPYINADRFNVFYEQHLFYALAQEKGIPIKVFSEDIVDDSGYKYLGMLFDRDYLHLLGPFKRDEYTCIKMAAKLRELYPEYYYRILGLFWKNKLTLSPCCFSDTDFEFMHEDSIRAYHEQRMDIDAYKSVVDENTNSHLRQLKGIAYIHSKEQNEEIFQQDFDSFYRQLTVLLNKKRSDLYLYGRDLEADHWYYDVFADTTTLPEKKLVKCKEVSVIQSVYNWAGLFNKYYQKEAGYYYRQLQNVTGEFSNLIIPEVSKNGFSLYDIDYLDYAVMNQLTEPLSVKELLLKMQDYFEDEVIQDHYDSFYEVILSCLKHLIEKKAIKPT